MRSHYFPAVGFGVFANPETNNVRNELLYCVQRGEPFVQKHLKAGSLGIKKDFYSPDRPDEAEQTFQLFEKGLKRDITAALHDLSGGGGAQGNAIGVAMLTQAASAYVRNPVHENRQETDQFGAILKAGQILHKLLLLGHHDLDRLSQKMPSPAQLPNSRRGRKTAFVDHVADRWEWAVLRTPSGSRLISADTPARVFRLESGAVIWLWPITHDALFVAVSRTHLQIMRRRLKPDEVRYVNSLVAAATFKWVVSVSPFTNDQVRMLAEIWTRIEPVTSSFNDGGWFDAVPLLEIQPPKFIQNRLSAVASGQGRVLP